MSSIKTTQIDGDVSVGRNVSLGGKAEIAGSAHIGHNLKVDGWLEAPNIKGANKGIFLTVQELREAYPVPHDGWMAGVGASTPFTAYVGKGGDWVATGGTIEVTVDMTEEIEQARDDALNQIGTAKSEALEEIDDATQVLVKFTSISGENVQLKDGQGNSLMPKTGESNVETKSHQYILGDARTVEAAQSYYITNTFTPLEKNKDYHVKITSSSPANRTYSVNKMVGATNYGVIASYPEGATEIEFDFNTGDYAINRFQITANNIAMTWTVEVFDIITENLEEKLDYLMTGKYTPSPYCSVSGSGSGWMTLTQHQHTIHPGVYCRLDIRLGSAATKDIIYFSLQPKATHAIR